MSTNDAATIAELATKAAAPKPFTLSTKDGREFMIMPTGFEAKDVTNPHGYVTAEPPYVRQSLVLQSVDSLVDYVTRYRTEIGSALFADIADSKIVAVLDYHMPAGEAGEGPPAAGRCQHQATLSLPYSEEWKTWTKVDGELMQQLAFARFLEENASDVVAPTAAELIEAVKDLQAHRKVNFTRAVRTASDNENFEFKVEAEAKGIKNGSVEIPTKFILSLPVYWGEPATELHAFLRWRLDEEQGQLFLGFVLHRREYVRQAVFKQIVLSLGERTECPAVYGRLGAK